MPIYNADFTAVETPMTSECEARNMTYNIDEDDPDAPLNKGCFWNDLYPEAGRLFSCIYCCTPVG